jgi:tetratricopeptide (TPR) repeat protein
MRISGWKSISSYLGRDRATAIRWANERGLPVRRIPGGKTATVYTLTEDIDYWLAKAGAESAANGLVSAPAITLPDSPEATALFIDARDHWAQRTPESVLIAIREFEKLTRLAPGFAPGFVGLAEARIAGSDYGEISEEASYGSAGRLVRHALDLDPLLVDAHRALGLIAYWWEHDPAMAGDHFRRAVALSPEEPLVHFWFAGVLADNGEYDAAQLHYDQARLRQPGSLPVQTHIALLRWHRGDGAGGVAELEEITRRNPQFPLAWYFLGLARLGDGDAGAYLEAVRRRAELRGERELLSQAAALESAWEKGGAAAMMRAAAERQMAIEASRPFPDHALAAFHASLSEDRALFLEVLNRAEAGSEKWGAASLIRRLRGSWADDPEIIALIKGRASPAMAR